MNFEIFKTDSRQDRVTLAPGTIITVQGTPVKALILLHSGLAEILDYPGSSTGVDTNEIIGHSLRVGLLKGESVCGVSGFFKHEPDRWSIRAISECSVSALPITSDELLVSIQSRQPLALQVLRATQQCIESAVFLFNNFKYLWHKLASMTDALALASDWLAMPGQSQAGIIPASIDRLASTPGNYSRALRTKATELKLLPAADWDANLFLDRVQVALGTYAELDALNIDSLFDYPQYLFLKRLIRRPDEQFLAFFDKDEPTQHYIFQFLSKGLETLLTNNRSMALKIRQTAERLYGKGGWTSELLALGSSRDDLHLHTFLHYLWKFSLGITSDAKKLLDISLAERYPALGGLTRYQEEPVALVDDGAAPDQAGNSAGEAVSKVVVRPELAAAYKGYAYKLVEFSELGKEFGEELQQALAALKALPDKLAAEKPAQVIREQLSNLYWKLYETCFLKVITSDMKSLVPGLLLHFGLLDETLLKPEELSGLDEAYKCALSVSEPIPVMTLPYFLEKIFTGAAQPSLSEMGESFAELLRRQEKMTPKEKAASFLYDDSPESKVRYELRQIAHNMARLLSGTRNRALPVLCSENLSGSISRLVQDPIRISMLVQQVRTRDFTLFQREVVLRHKFGQDLVQKAVLPNIVLYPVAGSRTMMWQELDGNRKDSAARIFLPVFYNEKPEESIVEMMAFLRWELSRSAAGHNWMDPVEGGLSGAYYDYIAYYRKNPDLSIAHKDVLKDFVARTRTDRDRFAEDYKSWVMHEFENKVRLNPVARAIFYRFCPFPAAVRAEMAKRPLYGDLETRYQNRARKDIMALESRMRKFEKAQETVPPEMVAWLQLLQG